METAQELQDEERRLGGGRGSPPRQNGAICLVLGIRLNPAPVPSFAHLFIYYWGEKKAPVGSKWDGNGWF